MDSFELNKIIGAILLVALLVIGIGKVSNLVFKINKPEKSNYKVELDVKSAEIKGDEEPVQREIVDIAALLSTGDLAHGEKVFKKCSACHSIKSGGGNKIGPALYNVVGRKVGVLDDYKYSKALAEYEKNWSFEELNGFLLKPKDWIKGTKMAYAGLRKEKDRASVILYLNKYSDSPLPLP
ncbi:c-type cytochrome [Candidatus Pelagibacter communis]|uniref:c-type cytochrome n=1 Tax=Pelagibacter ubique TaxID=198252 RepID=UPI00094D33EB|nr:cytochrome c family protein [Candidatus Pelagibacter ubique]